MAACQHQYPQHHGQCPHAVPAGATHCIWHNPLIKKSSDYIPDLLLKSSRESSGNLEGFHLAGLFWPRAELAGQCLRDADLRDAILDGGNFAGSDLSKAVLRRASFKNADLHGAILSGADLRDTNLSGANLRDCDLSYATLSGTILLNADLTGANLAGAKVSDFSWNRLTRFTGIKGLEPQRSVDEDDETQMFFAPLALGSVGEEALPKSDLENPDPFLQRTRVFVVPDASSRKKRQTAVAHRAPGGSPLRIAASLIFGAMAGAGASWYLLQGQPAAIESAPVVVTRPEDTKRQSDVYVQQIHELQARNDEALAKIQLMSQDATTQQAEMQKLQQAFEEARAEAARAHESDDKALMLSIQLKNQNKLIEDLAAASHRQERIASVLAEGAKRLEAEKADLAARLKTNVADQKLIVKLKAELSELKPALASAEKERDELTERNKKLSSELMSAWKDIERYLARVSGTGLQDYLIGSDTSAPFLDVTPGESIALGGDMLITLRLENGATPRSVMSMLTIQRPAEQGNPDITVALYDEQKRPLRRISYSFPHTDDGVPFTTASSTVACDTFPRFARIVIAPSTDSIAQKQ